MPYPPDPLETDATNATALEDEHPQRHNDTASAVNDLVSELGAGPKGAAADLTTRLTAMDATDAAKETPAGAQAKVDTHTADTTAVHGITDTTALIVEGDSRLTNARTPTGSAGGVLSGTYPNPAFAADMATQAELDAVAAAKANASHSHVVGDLPATLATDAEVTTAVSTHEAASDPHPGYLTTAEGNAAYEASGAVATHSADTTSVHGITDTSDLVLDDDARLSDDRTPTAHTIDGAKHTASGLTSGHVLRATGATTFAFGALQDGDIPATIARDSELPDLSGHVAAADPHAGYRLESVAITAADVAADVATQAELDAHLNDTTDAHDATAISFAPAGTIAATNVQAAIEEVAAEAGGGGVSDGDKGDITVSGSGATWTVDNNAITLTKLADIATARILGRVTASSGDPEELTAAQVKTLLALAAADVSDFATAVASTAVAKTILDANSILYATTDDTPAALAVAASRIVGRKATGDIGALTAAEANAILAPRLHVRDEKASGTHGGTFTSGAWQVRTLNTVKTNEVSGASLATNELTLPAGTYEVTGFAQVGDASGVHQARLYDVTGAAVLLLGNNAYSGVAASSLSVVQGLITVSVTSAVRLEHRCTTTQSTNGFGRASSWGTEVYAELLLKKLA